MIHSLEDISKDWRVNYRNVVTALLVALSRISRQISWHKIARITRSRNRNSFGGQPYML